MKTTVKVRRLNPGWAKKISKAVKGLESKEVAFGFPMGGKAASTTYDNGFSVLGNAIVQQFGADINHPGGTPYMIGKDGKAVFVRKDDPRAAGLPKTKPHHIKIRVRPFMDHANERVVADSRKEMVAVAKAANRGDVTGGQALKQVGLFGEKCVQEAITDGNYEPNAPATVQRKKSSKPLIDTGKMRQSVASVVRDRTD